VLFVELLFPKNFHLADMLSNPDKRHRMSFQPMENIDHVRQADADDDNEEAALENSEWQDTDGYIKRRMWTAKEEAILTMNYEL
jgi:hypothetical protein